MTYFQSRFRPDDPVRCRLSGGLAPLAVCVLLALPLAACGRADTSESLYRSGELGVAKTIRRCRVLETREIVIRDENQSEGAIAGGLAGALLGGTAGSTVGSGSGRRIATQVGALAGAAAGAAAGEALQEGLSERAGVEYSIVFSDGEEATVAQELLEDDRVIQPGDTCRFQQAAGLGRGRILPGEHLPGQIQAPKETLIIN